MRTLAVPILLLTALGVAPAWAQLPASWDDVTVTMADGWNLPGCSVRWLEDGSQLRVTRADGTWKDFTPELVARFATADGADLTADVMAARPGGPAVRAREADPAGDFSEVGAVRDDRPRRAAAMVRQTKIPLFRVMAGLGAGWGTYSGDWFEGFQSDISWHGRLRLNTGGKGWFTAGYQRQGGGRTEGRFYDETVGWLDVSAEVHLNEFQLLVGSAIGRAAPGASCGYFEGGLVIIQHVVSGTVSGYGSGTDSETRLGSLLLLGGIIPLGRATILDVGGSVLVKSGLFNDNEAGGVVFGVHVGVAYVDW